MPSFIVTQPRRYATTRPAWPPGGGCANIRPHEPAATIGSRGNGSEVPFRACSASCSRDMRRPNRERRNLGAALLAGLVCGGLWMLFATTILAVARPGMTTVPVTLGVWGVTGLAVAALCWSPGTPRQIWGRLALTVGFHALALPVAAAISFGATGIWPPPETADLALRLDVFGVRLVGTPATVRLGVGGFVLGLLLVSIGDRALRRRGMATRMPRGGGHLFR